MRLDDARLPCAPRTPGGARDRRVRALAGRAVARLHLSGGRCDGPAERGDLPVGRPVDGHAPRDAQRAERDRRARRELLPRLHQRPAVLPVALVDPDRALRHAYRGLHERRRDPEQGSRRDGGVRSAMGTTIGRSRRPSTTQGIRPPCSASTSTATGAIPRPTRGRRGTSGRTGGTSGGRSTRTTASTSTTTSCVTTSARGRGSCTTGTRTAPRRTTTHRRCSARCSATGCTTATRRLRSSPTSRRTGRTARRIPTTGMRGSSPSSRRSRHRRSMRRTTRRRTCRPTSAIGTFRSRNSRTCSR